MLKQNFIAVLVGLFSFNLNAQTLITGVTATASSAHHPEVYSATHAVDGSGLYLGSYPNQIHHGGHHGGVGNSMRMIWISEEPNDEWFKVDLGDRYAVETLRIWNGSFRGSIDTDSIKDVDIYYSSELSDPGSNFTDPNSSWKLFGSHTFAINPAGSHPHNYAKTEELALGDIDARWIALDIKNNYGFDDWMSIGELQFDGSSIPDTDEDGVYDPDDAFPSDPSESVDTDGDGVGNNADADDDGDGLSDLEEATNGTNPLLADTDGDGVGDNADTFPSDPIETTDSDSDGVGDNGDAYPNYNDNVILNFISEYISTHDYKTLDEIKDARVGSTMIEVSEGKADITMTLEETSNLNDWSSATKSEKSIEVDAPAGTRFYRFKMAE